MNVNIWNIFWTADERSNRRKILAVTTQLKQLRKESLKKIQAWTGFELMTSAMSVQCWLSYQANWELVCYNDVFVATKEEKLHGSECIASNWYYQSIEVTWSPPLKMDAMKEQAIISQTWSFLVFNLWKEAKLRSGARYCWPSVVVSTEEWAARFQSDLLKLFARREGSKGRGSSFA